MTYSTYLLYLQLDARFWVAESMEAELSLYLPVPNSR